MTRARYRLSELIFTSDQPIPELEPEQDGDAPAETDVRWMRVCTVPRAGHVFSSWATAEGPDWLTFADVAGGFLLTFPALGQFDVSADASQVAVHPFAGTSPAVMRHLLLNQVLPLALARRGRLVLHGSAISYRDRVVLLVGRGGSGKSTLAVACADAGASIVSDDCLVLNRRADAWTAVPCHAGVRLWPSALELLGWRAEAGEQNAEHSDKRRFDARDRHLTFESRELPIAGIVYLPPVSAAESPTSALGPGARSRIVRGRDAVMALASELFRLDSRDAAESRRQFHAVAEMAARVPMEIMERQSPSEAATAVLCRMSDSWRRPGD